MLAARILAAPQCNIERGKLASNAMLSKDLVWVDTHTLEPDTDAAFTKRSDSRPHGASQFDRTPSTDKEGPPLKKVGASSAKITENVHYSLMYQ